jgi:eukaryotic-like serine/threonine-protein kinase
MSATPPPAPSASPPDHDAVDRLLDALLDAAPEARAAVLAASGATPAVQHAAVALLHGSDAAADMLPAPGDAAPRLPPGTRIEGWRVLRVLGRGGMGEVYLVEREGADFVQRGALKLMTALHGDDLRRRFALERRILARLAHPGIARLLDGGEWQGLPWAVMEYVDGQALDLALAGRAPREIVASVLQVCEAVAYAHQQLVLHRDLKPANILLDADGRVRLLDFGIARLLDEADASLTQAPRLSPHYAAPEQLRGESPGIAADVFALGVVLHELLVGRRLFGGGAGTLQVLAERLAGDRVAAPSAQAPPPQRAALHGDLDAIVMKALRPEPAQRYASVAALADDLRAWLAGEPVAARADERGYHTRRLLRRYRWWLGAAAAAMLALATGSAVFAWQAHQLALERDLARREAERVDALRQYLMLMFREAGAAGAETPTAKAVLDAAAARLAREYGSETARYADVAIALSDLYFHLNDYVGAEAVLRELLALGQRLPSAAAAMARHNLAQLQFRGQQADEARANLAQAQGFWAADPRRWRNELLESRLLQSQLERLAGDRPRALATLREALVQRVALSGERHRETAILVNNLGIAEFEAGELDAAVASFARADTIWQALDLGRSADALNTLNNWASAEQRRGRPAAAISLFERALALRRELYGPSAALAALAGNLGKTLLQAGRNAEALPLLREARELGMRYAGERSVVALSASLGLVDALLASGEPGQAKTLLDVAAAGIEAEYPAQHPLQALRWISAARLHAAQADMPARDAALDRAQQLVDGLGPAGRAYAATISALREAP